MSAQQSLIYGSEGWTQKQQLPSAINDLLLTPAGAILAVGDNSASNVAAYRSVNAGESYNQHSTYGATINAVAAGGGALLAVCVGSGNYWWSGSDGQSWESRQMTQSTLLSVTADGSAWVIGGNTGRISISNDGASWTHVEPGASTSTFLGPIIALAAGGGTTIAVGGADFDGQVSTSGSSGATWTKRLSGLSNKPVDVCYGDGAFVVVCDGGAIHRTANLGVTWQTMNPYGNNLSAVAWDSVKQLFCATEMNTGYALISGDGGFSWV